MFSDEFKAIKQKKIPRIECRCAFLFLALVSITQLWHAVGWAPDECATRLAASEELVQNQRGEIAELREKVRALRAALWQATGQRTNPTPLSLLLPPATEAAVATPRTLSHEAGPCDAEHHFGSQEDLQLFAAGNCSVLGALIIEGTVSDLRPLASLREVQGNLIIHASWLESLAGLEGLTTVGGHLDLANNWRLISVQGLNGLTSVESFMFIYDNGALKTLKGLEGLTTVRGTLEIAGNTRLTSLQGLGGLISVGGNLHIFNNDRLNTLQGLDGLSSVRETLEIIALPSLNTLQGLGGLISVGHLTIYDNPNLNTLKGLEGLTVVEGNVRLIKTGVASLQGLEQLRVVEGFVAVEGNGRLASVEGLSSLGSTGGLFIDGNLLLESLKGLESLTDVWGKVYIANSPLMRSLRGLDGVSRAADVQIKGCGPMDFLGSPFTSDAVIRSFKVDESSWPQCVTPHEQAMLVGKTMEPSRNLFPRVSLHVWRKNSCGPDLVTCTRGMPCDVNLAGANLTGVVSIFLSGRHTGCGVCTQGRERANVTGTTAHFGTRLWHEDGGLYSLCRCAHEALLGPLAPMMLVGPTRKLYPEVCVRGTACTAKLEGEGLDAGKMLVARRCGQQAIIPGTVNGTHFLADLASTSEAPPGAYELCWRSCDSCEYFKAGDFLVQGAIARDSREVVVLSDGKRWMVPNVGLEVTGSDRMRLLRKCGQPNGEGFPVMERVSGPGMIFDFGALTTSDVLPSSYRKCWCSRHAVCVDDADFLVDTGSVQFLCPPAQESSGSEKCRKCPAGKSKAKESPELCGDCMEGTFAAEEGLERCNLCPVGKVAQTPGSVHCSACHFGRSPAPDATACSWNPGKVAAFASYLACVFIATAVLVLPVKRPMRVVDVSLIEGRTIVTVLRPHGLRMLGRKHFPVQLRDTEHPDLDSPKAPYQAKVSGSASLELLGSQGEQLKMRLDTSRGTIILGFGRGSWHNAWLVPSPILAAVLLIAALLVANFSAESEHLAFAFGALAAFLVALMMSLVWRMWPAASPLDICLANFSDRVEKQQGRRPGQQPASCAKGAGRALRVGKLHDLLEFFHEFIRDRTAYYLDCNIIRPLTGKFNTSYAEFVGADQVEWFVSHYWGTAFADFCQALRKHAEKACGNREWTTVCYWICFCANNQNTIEDEMGTSWQETSFFLTLQSGLCLGTCMVLDDKALPLTRSWCIFELLQTVHLQQSQQGFEGLILCTPSGVLNSGDGSVEVAMALAERVARVDLETAKATKPEDTAMINEQVAKDLGSFDALNHFVRDEVYQILRTAQVNTTSKFIDVLRKLRNNGTVSV